MAQSDEEVPGQRRLVLLVEDELSIRDALREILIDEGYEVRCASNGEEALELLPSLPSPLAVIVDLMMPVMDGWELIRRMKADPRLGKLPVVVVSAATRVSPIPGVDRFLRKPINLELLLEALELIFNHP